MAIPNLYSIRNAETINYQYEELSDKLKAQIIITWKKFFGQIINYDINLYGEAWKIIEAEGAYCGRIQN